MSFQDFSDTLLERTLLPFIPHRITPNHLSALRLCSLPILYYLLSAENYTVAFIIFLLAALTDIIDGPLARTRGQVSEVGKILDPIADRGLMALIALTFVPVLFGWRMLLLLVFFELCNAAMAYRSRRKLGYNPGANWAGKVKMLLQCIAFAFIMVTFMGATSALLWYAYYLLIASLIFTLVQSFLYPQK